MKLSTEYPASLDPKLFKQMTDPRMVEDPFNPFAQKQEEHKQKSEYGEEEYYDEEYEQDEF